MTFISHEKRKIISFTCCNYCKSLSCDWLYKEELSIVF